MISATRALERAILLAELASGLPGIVSPVRAKLLRMLSGMVPVICTDIAHTLYWSPIQSTEPAMLTSSKTQRVDLRISPAAKEMIQAAAQAQDKTVSEFLIDSGLTSAAETLADRRLFILDDAQWQAFQTALDAPPRARPRLARLMKTGK
jgi:uncharacterized protein (DUF1778 family)